MNGLFIGEDEEIRVKFVTGVSESGKACAEADKDNLVKSYPTEVFPDASITEHEAVFRRPSFADSVAVSSNAYLSVDGTGVEFAPLKLRYARLVRLLKSWTLKDDKGTPVEPTEINIRRLSPPIANMIGLLLEAAIGSEF